MTLKAQCKINVYSEDIAEIRSAIYVALIQRNPQRQKELEEIMDKIYTALFMDRIPVILEDSDKRDFNK